MTFIAHDPHTLACSQQGAEVSRQSAQTFTLRVANLFKRKPNTWIRASEIQDVGGYCAWRTRISNCRKQFAMQIENRVRTEHDHADYCAGLQAWDINEACNCGLPKRWKVSEYRFIPEHAGEQSGRLF